MKRKELNIGLFGFGTVGKGLFDVLNQTTGIKANIEKICVKDRNKKRSIEDSFFTFDKNELLENPDINVIVELIDDPDAAFEIVTAALKKGKAVVTANKKLVAEHMSELMELQQKYNVPLLYEAACCASLPLIRNLEEYYDNDLLQSIKGIVNGCTNYMLTHMLKDNLNFEETLKHAQGKGFAESNPCLDIEGFDAKYKLTILLLHAFGIEATPDEIWNMGIQNIGELEKRFAAERGLKIKLMAHAKKVGDKVIAFVAPQFVNKNDKLFFTDNEYNGIIIESLFADKQFIEGKGAGAYPTASAVLSDISALTYDYRYEYKKVKQNTGLKLTNDFSLEVLVRFNENNISFENSFTKITEEYHSYNQHYIVGKIDFAKLISAPWINKVSVIITEKNFPLTVANHYETLSIKPSKPF